MAIKITPDLQEIPLDIALKVGDIFSFDCYVKLPSGKMVKICQGEGDNMLETFKRYKAKGVTTFYAKKEDLIIFLQTYQQGLGQKIFDPASIEKEKVESLTVTFELVKEAFTKLKIDIITIEMAEATAKESLRLIRNSPNLFNFFKSFRASCGDEFMNGMLVTYITSIILEQFSWSSSEIKKKLSLAVLLSDITLSNEDIILLRQYEESDPSKLPEHIYNHPLLIAEIVRVNRHYGIPGEVADIIEQHHELPLKAGFPSQLDYSRITLFSAVLIVAYHFIKEIRAYDFDYNHLEPILTEMNDKFNKGNYEKVMKTLVAVLQN